MEPKKTVKDGYNAITNQYLASRTRTTADLQLLDEFISMLPAKAHVLDAGCGAGVPVAKILSEQFDVTGVDFSEKQIELARKLVPNAIFICQDMTVLEFPPLSFDGICSFYSIIHIPRKEHRMLLENFYQMLKPDGLALLCLGAEELEADFEEDFHGQRMYWSHFDADTYKKIVKEIGFHLLSSKIVPDETYGGNHLFVLAKKGNLPT